MKVELDVDVERLVAAVLEEQIEIPDADDLLREIDGSDLADKLSGYFADPDDVLNEDAVRDICREYESDGSDVDEDQVIDIARRQLESVPSNDGGLCGLGEAFRHAVHAILKCESTKELLQELRNEENESAKLADEPMPAEPMLTLYAVSSRDEVKLIHVSPTEDQAQNLAGETGRHGTLVDLAVPLSLARRLLDNSIPQCSAQWTRAQEYRLVPNAVYSEVENDDATKARCGDKVREWVTDQDMVHTTETWLAVYQDRSVAGPFPTEQQALEYVVRYAQGMGAVVRQASTPMPS